MKKLLASIVSFILILGSMGASPAWIGHMCRVFFYQPKVPASLRRTD
ncbi:MAG: cyclic lactone autoinducer peptide [Oscillospiraceae bacterium]|nr:cyclic lactone autoinducer peptide [Oscillospiraceae bacterium]